MKETLRKIKDILKEEFLEVKRNTETKDKIIFEPKEKETLIVEAIEQLKADERALITLYYMEEKPLTEVAFILGITEGNAKVKLHRIRKKLYILIKQQE